MDQPNIIYPPGHESAPAVSTPTPPPTVTPEPTNPKQKSGVKTVIVVILILLLIGGAGYGAYYYQQQRIDSQNVQINSLNHQIASLQKQIKAAKTAPSTTVTNQNVIKITNLGFQITVPDSIKDLTFTTSSTTSASLSTASLTAKDAACADNATVSGLGVFSKGTGVYKTPIASPPILVKQFNGFYITYSSPQANCSTNVGTMAIANSQSQVLQSAFPSASLITN